MSDFLKVHAVGASVPMEHQLGHIGAEPTQVPNTYYYRQRLAAGEIVLVRDAQAAASTSSYPTNADDEHPRSES